MMLIASCVKPEDSNSKVLIVEDADDLADMMNLVISSAGFKCEIASSLAEARKKLGSQRYRFLLLDMILPDGCGLNLIEDGALKSNDYTEVLVTSGNVSEEIRQAGRVSACFQKPFSVNNLIEFMQGQLKGSK